jgi:hypothetical protein
VSKSNNSFREYLSKINYFNNSTGYKAIPSWHDVCILNKYGYNVMDKALEIERFPDPMQEKRRYERYPADFLDINGRILFSSGITIHNISIGGIAFSTDKKLIAGRNYALRLESKGRILNIMGTIMWSRSSSTNQENGSIFVICTVGMKFLNLSGRQVIELEHFIKDNFKDYQNLAT